LQFPGQDECVKSDGNPRLFEGGRRNAGRFGSKTQADSVSLAVAAVKLDKLRATYQGCNDRQDVLQGRQCRSF
jgi:hypothetical protein